MLDRSRMEESRKEGWGLFEYALIFVLVAIVIVVLLIFLGPSVGTIYSSIGPNI